MIFGYNEDGNVRAEITDTSFKEKPVYDIAFGEYEKVLTACLMENGNISTLTSENSNCCFNIYDIKSKEISTCNLSDNIYNESQYVQLYSAENEFYICTNRNIITYAGTGNIVLSLYSVMRYMD